MSESSKTGSGQAIDPRWCAGGRFPEKLSLLRQKLHHKAKSEPGFRFYSLKGLILRSDVLWQAWVEVRRNGGAPGIDRQTIEDIERQPGGPQALIDELAEELRTRRYKPRPVKRVYIPKPDGRERPLGVPCVRDRVLQAAAKLVIEPIFEADFLDCSYGFRPGRKAHGALDEVRKHLGAGYTAVYDADLKGYFDTIPHDKLMLAVERRIADRSVLSLIRLWLAAPIVDERKGGPPQRPDKGTPQGGVLSPLLANLYLHWFDRTFHSKTGPAQWARAKLVRYADDFVILARHQGPRLTGWVESLLEGRFGLTINREKTKVIDLTKDGATLDFLGFTLRYERDLFGRARKYLNVFPSKKARARLRDKVRALTGPDLCFAPIPAVIRKVNHVVRGWGRYFDYGYPKLTFKAVDHFTLKRLAKHLDRRSQRPYRQPKGTSFYAHMHEKLGLLQLWKPTPGFTHPRLR